jgi:hypothetical protein
MISFCSGGLEKNIHHRGHGEPREMAFEKTTVKYLVFFKVDGLAKSQMPRHPGESRGPEHLEITGFRLSPE